MMNVKSWDFMIIILINCFFTMKRAKVSSKFHFLRHVLPASNRKCNINSNRAAEEVRWNHVEGKDLLKVIDRKLSESKESDIKKRATRS